MHRGLHPRPLLHLNERSKSSTTSAMLSVCGHVCACVPSPRCSAPRLGSISPSGPDCAVPTVPSTHREGRSGGSARWLPAVTPTPQPRKHKVASEWVIKKEKRLGSSAPVCSFQRNGSSCW